MDERVRQSLDEPTRNLLAEALRWHGNCEMHISGVQDERDAVRRLKEIEQQTWSESALEPENRPLIYRHLLSMVHDPKLIEQRRAECKHDYLNSIIGQRYAELLAGISDPEMLTERAVATHPDLRPFVILRLQEILPQALKTVSRENVPSWFVRMLRQPWQVRNYLSQPTCSTLVAKIKELVVA
jgi:hypothetical protein